MVNNDYECEIEFKKYNLLPKDIFEPVKKLITIIDEYQSIVGIINNSFEKRFSSLYFPINKSKNLKKQHLSTLKDKYVYFDKLDGIRYFLVESFIGTYLVNQTNYIKLNDDKKMVSIYDVEYTNKVNVFDTIIYKNKDVRKLNFFERFKYVMKSGYSYIHYSVDYGIITYSNGCDGIIFTPVDMEYKNNFTFKYKPSDELTIDFLVINNTLNVTDNNGDTIFFKECDNFKKYHNQIVECKWSGIKFIPIRIRTDKLKPNHIDVAKDIWEDIQDPIDLSDIMNYNKGV